MTCQEYIDSQPDVEKLRASIASMRKTISEWQYDYKSQFADGCITEIEKLQAELAAAQDQLDLMSDEFKRIASLTNDAEIEGLCIRARGSIQQTVPLIEQRDAALKELAVERSLLKLAHEELDICKEELSECRAELERTRQAMVMAQVEARRLIGAEKASEIETLTRERDAAREELARANALNVKLAVKEGDEIKPKSAPRCPRCESDLFMTHRRLGGIYLFCRICEDESDTFPTLDAALDAWRKA